MTMNYGYGFTDNVPMEMMTFILSVLGIFIGVFVIIGLLSYVFGSLGLYIIARNRGYDKPFLAWIPVVSSYLLGAVGDDINAKQGKKTYYGIIFIAYSVLSMVLSGVSSSFMTQLVTGYTSSYGMTSMVNPASAALWILMSVAGIAITVLQFIVYHKIYKTYTPQNATLLLVLSVIFAFIIPFVMFAIRNNRPVDAAGPRSYGPPPPPYGQDAYPGNPGAYRNAQDAAQRDRNDNGNNTGEGI